MTALHEANLPDDGPRIFALRPQEVAPLYHQVQEYCRHGVRVREGDVVFDVGANIGANLQADQAAADLRVAQANAEKRRALAVALEQEMRAKVEENRAAVVLSEAEVPRAIAQAFRDGRLGIMDYYGLKNLQSDTQMRNAIAGASGTRYSLLPPENATGNYVKVVQRIPVKIIFDKGQDPEHLLRPGMSVEPDVRVR